MLMVFASNPGPMPTRPVIASEAKQSGSVCAASGLPRDFVPRNDEGVVAVSDLEGETSC